MVTDRLKGKVSNKCYNEWSCRGAGIVQVERNKLLFFINLLILLEDVQYYACERRKYF